ncbi:autotransporter outer membrane beta-barrel domain-containing protein, partial [Stenotrophomonas sp. S41]|uniref:autotransporter outer membrane beta-barrel domain-containing protein n=1 Tax=Stenotrophomonas sp. S41 TaxID=2767464 RepID=UPI001909468D
MMRTTANTLSLAIAASLLLVTGATHAAQLYPGQVATVRPGDTPETWLVDGATLNVNPGGSTLAIEAVRQSTLRIDEAQVEAAARTRAGITLQSSSLTLTNSTVNNSIARGMTLATGSGGQGSTANISNSQITGLGLGISVLGSPTGGRSTLTLDRTQVLGRMDASAAPALNGNGILAFDAADILIGNGSVVTGEVNGVSATGNQFTSPDASTVAIDASRVEGKTGAALFVAPPPGTNRVDGEVQFIARNGAELVGSNGNLLEVTAAAAKVGFTVDNSNLIGNIINTGGSTVDVALTNNATLLGVTQGITSMSLDNARWQMSGDSSTGSLSLGSGGEIALGDGSAFHTLNVSGNFTGADGTLIFNTVLAGDDAASDKLVIGGDTSGTANVRVNNVGGAGAQTVNGIELIQVGGASNGQFNLAGRAVGGQYEYFLHKGTGTDGNWYLRSVLPTAPDPCEVDPSLPECNP